jgi:hypothetical protein
MARIVPRNAFGAPGYTHENWGASRQTEGSDKWLSPEGITAAVNITNTVGGALSNAVSQKMDRDKILNELDVGKKLSRMAREAKLEGEGDKVAALQKAILAQGGKLANYGADAKYGSETEAALKGLQDKRAQKIFGKGGRADQFTQYDLAQKEAGSYLDRIIAGVGEVGIPIGGGQEANIGFAGAGDPVAMEAARLRAQGMEEQALARQSAAAAYRQAAGAETMAQRRAATSSALSAYDRRRAPTLLGQLAGEGQQAITEDLKRLFPGRKPQPRSMGRGAPQPLARDMEKDLARSERNLKVGELAMKYQSGKGFSNNGFRKLSEGEIDKANLAGSGDVWIPKNEFLSKSTKAKLKSTDLAVRRQGYAEALAEAESAKDVSDTLGNQLSDRVESQRKAHNHMTRTKGLSMTRGRDQMAPFMEDPRYAQAIGGIDLTREEGSSVRIVDGVPYLNGEAPIQQLQDGGYVYPSGETLSGEDVSQLTGGAASTSANADASPPGPRSTAQQADRKTIENFGSDSDIEAMRKKAKETIIPASEPAPVKETEKPKVAKSPELPPKTKKKKPRRKRNLEELRKKLNDDLKEDESPRVAAAKQETKRRKAKATKPSSTLTMGTAQQSLQDELARSAREENRRGEAPLAKKKKRKKVAKPVERRGRRKINLSEDYKKEDTVTGYKVVRKNQKPRSKKRKSIDKYINQTPKLRFPKNAELRREFIQFAMKNGLEQAKVKFGFAQASAGQ